MTYPVVITVDNAEQKLRPGMTAIVTLDGARRNRATRIPNSALSFVPSPRVLAATEQKAPGPPPLPTNKESGNVRVWAYDGTEFTPIMIRTGLADDHWTELVSGPLEPGATLVTNAAIGGEVRSGIELNEADENDQTVKTEMHNRRVRLQADQRDVISGERKGFT